MANPRAVPNQWVPNRPTRHRSNPAPNNRSGSHGPVSKVKQYIHDPTPPENKYKNECMFPRTYMTDVDLEEKNMAESIMEEYKDDPTLIEMLKEIDNNMGDFRKDTDSLAELRTSIASTQKNMAQAKKISTGLEKTVKVMNARSKKFAEDSPLIQSKTSESQNVESEVRNAKSRGSRNAESRGSRNGSRNGSNNGSRRHSRNGGSKSSRNGDTFVTNK